VGTESIAELSPRYLVVRRPSGGIVGPPCAGVTTQQLRGEESLLHLGATQELKLGLHHPKPVISQERLSYLGEEQRVSGLEVAVGGWSQSGCISGPIATTSRVGHLLMQQLSLLIPGCKDRGDRLSYTWRWRQVPVSLGALGPSPSVVSVHHSVIQTHYY
jgi:hypothetical protein